MRIMGNVELSEEKILLQAMNNVCIDICKEHNIDTGRLSDGYHTFDELYHHRTVLFSIVCNQNEDVAWKSRLHHDGTMYDGMFIVGILTEDGDATYHCDNKYWDMFNVQELSNAPEWDGHTPEDAVDRLMKLSGSKMLDNRWW